MVRKHRLFVLTDIENEPDDTQSLVRLLLYSNEVDIQGLVAVTSTWIRTQVRPDSIEQVIKAYAIVRPNLLRASREYPTAEQLLGLVAHGYVGYGMQAVGDGYDSSGSENLIKAVDQRDPAGRPLHVALWGGANCLAQALYKVRRDRSPSELDAFISRMRIYGISDQDDAGPWIRRNFPKLPYVVSVHGENVYLGATWIGFATENPNGLPGATPDLISKSWIKQNIQIGPLGSTYPDIMYGMEGDTPSYLSCIPNGLNDPERPDFGGWGGRYKQIYDPEANHYHDACDRVTSQRDGSVQRSAAASIWRWRDDVQNDFAARMQWTVEQDAQCLEYPPIVVVDGDESNEFLERKVKVGETITVDASATRSPCDHALEFEWFQYKEIDSVMPVPMEVPDFDMHGTAKSSRLTITAPETTAHVAGDRVEFEAGRTYHIILRVTSRGKWALTRYRRLLLAVLP